MVKTKNFFYRRFVDAYIIMWFTLWLMIAWKYAIAVIAIFTLTGMWLSNVYYFNETNLCVKWVNWIFWRREICLDWSNIKKVVFKENDSIAYEVAFYIQFLFKDGSSKVLTYSPYMKKNEVLLFVRQFEDKLGKVNVINLRYIKQEETKFKASEQS